MWFNNKHSRWSLSESSCDGMATMMCSKRLMSDNEWHVYTSTSLLLMMLVRVRLMTVMRMTMLTERFLQLLVLAAYCDAVDVHRYGHDKTRRFPAVARYRRPDTAGKVAGSPADSRQQRATTAALHHTSLDPLPLGSPVLKPDLDLDFAETQLTCDHRALGQ